MPDTTLAIDRLDGETLVLDGYGLASAFFKGDQSSIGVGAYDSLAGNGDPRVITTGDLEAINRTMRARSRHQAWQPLLNRPLTWLSALHPDLDLIAASEDEWNAAKADRGIEAALRETIGPSRGVSVATKVLHLKRPRLVPVLDDLVAVMLGRNMPTEASHGRRVELAMELVLHLRREGRRNLPALMAVQGSLRQEGIDRPLLRILDAIVWFSHPAAGVTGARREITVRANP